MKQTILRYGIYSSLCLVGIGMINLLFLSRSASYGMQEVVGYLAIFISMIFVFLGIRHYRDQVNEGSLSFGEGLKVGILIVLIPAVLFGCFDVLYTEVINPSWKEDYFNNYLEKLKSSVPAASFEAERLKLLAQKELFGSPLMQFLIMALTVFAIGLIVTIISSLALRRNKRFVQSNAT